MKLNPLPLKLFLRQALIFALVLSVVVPVSLSQSATTVLADKAGVCAVPGKDGPTTTLSGVVNSYYPGTANVTANATSIPVGAARAGGGPAIAAGDLLLVVQMQGADLDGNNDQRYGSSIGTAGITNPTASYTVGEPIYAGSNLAVNFSPANMNML